MINVMIVDNESAIRKGMLHFIQWTSLGCEIAAQAGDGQAALDLLGRAGDTITHAADSVGSACRAVRHLGQGGGETQLHRCSKEQQANQTQKLFHGKTSPFFRLKTGVC